MGQTRYNYPMQSRLKKLHYHSWHRGTRENDLLLGRFADQTLEALTSEELTQYEALLNLPDTTLYEWMSGQGEPPVEFQPLVAKIRAFHA